jgi:hypothetical protein
MSFKFKFATQQIVYSPDRKNTNTLIYYRKVAFLYTIRMVHVKKNQFALRPELGFCNDEDIPLCAAG